MATDARGCWRQLVPILLVLGSAFPVFAATPRDCSRDHCGLLADGPYANLVIGTLDYVGNDDDMRRVFHWAKAIHKYPE